MAACVMVAVLDGVLLDLLPGGFRMSAGGESIGEDLAALVDPFIGTAPQRPDGIPGDGPGGAFPGAAAPFGMVQWSPDTSGRATAGSGGYRYADSTIDGFSLTHLHGTSCPAAQDLAVMPTVGPLPEAPPTGRAEDPSPWATGFSHAAEAATPGRYQVELDGPDGVRIGVDLAAGQRSAIGQFTYPSGRGQLVVLDAGRRADGALRADLHVDPTSGEVSGSITARTFCRRAAVSTLYFVARPDRRPVAAGTWSAGRWSSDLDAADEGGTSARSRSASVGAWLELPPTANGELALRVAVSYVSVAGARANLAAEAPVDVDEVAKSTRAEWNRRLSTVRAAGVRRADLRPLYTALYHSMLGPGRVSDVDGSYLGWDGRTAAADGWTPRSGVAGWDAYRTTFPLLAILAPDIATDVARSLLAGASQTGSVPGWTLATSRPDVMPGDGGTILLAQAVAFGLPIDPAEALDAALSSASRRPFALDYDRLGYVPAPPDGPADAASITLEYALADFATAELALAAGEPEVAAMFAERSGRWRSVWDQGALLPAPRGLDGQFLPVEPTALAGFTEGTAAQYSWLVPQDPDGLTEAMGGAGAAADRLTDFLARIDDGAAGSRAEVGNQPSLLAAWFGHWLGAPELTVDALGRARQTVFRDTPDGIPGNDDTGGLSAFYVLAWLGFGPVRPGTDLLALTPPAAPTVEVSFGGRSVRILTERSGGSGDADPAGVRRGEQDLPGWWTRARELAPGAVLTWTFHDAPTDPG